MKIVLVANTSWYLINFRSSLIRSLAGEGHEVTLVAPRDDYSDQLADLGARWIDWPIDRRGLALRPEVAAVSALQSIYEELRPDVVHHFTLKPVLYGTYAARRATVALIVNSVTGLGHVFTSRSVTKRLLKRVLLPWIGWSLRGRDVRTIFQSAEDLYEIASERPSVGATAVLVPGSGVNVDQFRPGDRTRADHNVFRAVFVGRLIEEKGIQDFVEAASILQGESENCVSFIACGTADPGNPTSIPEDTLQRWERSGDVEFLGHVNDTATVLASADVVVLPSYREGTSRVLLEAAASGIPAIATNVPGCRNVVDDGETGLLVGTSRPDEIASAVTRLSREPEVAERLGENARVKAVREFDERIVLRRISRCYADLVERGRVESEWSSGSRPGVLTISLDFELAWGTRNRPAAAKVGPWLEGTRPAIEKLLSLFESYEVSATWATVGALMLGGRSREFLGDRFGGDNFHDVPDGDAKSAPDWYADDVVEQLLACRVEQELACHTLTHAFVDPTAAGRTRLDLELRGFQELWDELGLGRCQSFIFPKAYMGHFGLLAEHGYQAIRGPEPGWFERIPHRQIAAAFRLLNARRAATPAVGRPELIGSGLWQIPSSQFYSPIMNVGQYVPTAARVLKAKRGLRAAAATRSIYHLWTHPFNLGLHTDELLAGFEEILREATKLRDAGQLVITPMKYAVLPYAKPSQSVEPATVEPATVESTLAAAESP